MWTKYDITQCGSRGGGGGRTEVSGAFDEDGDTFLHEDTESSDASAVDLTCVGRDELAEQAQVLKTHTRGQRLAGHTSNRGRCFRNRTRVRLRLVTRKIIIVMTPLHDWFTKLCILVTRSHSGSDRGNETE